jgi:choline dehydrogenase-like flavoprotein
MASYKDSHMEGNHWAETCALGQCVDPRTMEVHQTENVHVADASLLPHQMSSHPMLTVAAMARNAAQRILVNSGIAACASNPKCVAEGMEGQCCPSFDAVMLSCCAARL